MKENGLKMLLLSFLILLFGLSGCDLFFESSPGHGERPGDKITISGSFGDAETLQALQEEGEEIPDRVVVFYTNFSHHISQVEEGFFEIEVERDEPVGMIFVNENDEFLGLLSYKGLDSLPLNCVDEDVVEIDLGELKLEDKVTEPDPEKMDEIFDLSEGELASLIQANAFFASIARNPDVTGDGTVDILEGNYYYLQVTYFLENPQEPMRIKDSELTYINEDGTKSEKIANYRLGVDMGLEYYDKYGDDVRFYYVDGNKEMEFLDSVTYPHHVTYRSAAYQGVPGKGDYIIEFGNGEKTLHFTIPDQEYAIDNVIAVNPSRISLDGDLLETIFWDYNVPGDPHISVENIIERVRIYGFKGQDRVLASPDISPANTSWNMSAENITLGDLKEMAFGSNYIDIYGNSYSVGFFMCLAFLEIKKIELEPDNPEKDEEIKFSVEIENTGFEGGSGDILVEILNNGEKILEKEEALSLEKDENYKLIFETQLPSGKYDIKASSYNHSFQKTFEVADE